MKKHMLPALAATFTLAFLLFVTAQSHAADPALSPEQGYALMAEHKNLVVLDVRTPAEYHEAHYPAALNIPVTELKERMAELPTDKDILIYCARGKRAAQAYAIFQEMRPSAIEKVLFIDGKPRF